MLLFTFICVKHPNKNVDGTWYFFDNMILLQISTFSSIDPNAIVPLQRLPCLQAIYTLDAVISKVQVSLDEHLSKVAIEAGTHKSSEVTKNLLPATLQLTDVYTAFTRWGLHFTYFNDFWQKKPIQS